MIRQADRLGLCCWAGKEENQFSDGGRLADLAPTILLRLLRLLRHPSSLIQPETSHFLVLIISKPVCLILSSIRQEKLKRKEPQPNYSTDGKSPTPGVLSDGNFDITDSLSFASLPHLRQRKVYTRRWTMEYIRTIFFFFHFLSSWFLPLQFRRRQNVGDT